MDLRQLDIVITRPRAQAESWRRQLSARGARCHLLSVLEIVPVSDPRDLEAVKARILALADYQKLIFVSQNAVQQAMEWIDRYWPQLPIGVHYFAVGSATAALAREWGLEIEAAGQAMNSEALLELPGLQTVEHEKVLVCRGAGGRTHLGDELRRRGAQVDYCELYRRHLPDDASQRFRELQGLWDRASEGHAPAVAVHSGESLQNLSQLIDDIALPACAEALRANALLVVPGARVAELARQLGFHRLLVATNATDDAMTAALLQGKA